MIQINENGRVNAREIYSFIGVKSRFNDWIRNSLEYVDAKEGIDFYLNLSKSTGGRPSIDYEINIDCAKEICLVQPNPKSKELRRWLISLGNKIDTGLLFSPEQINFLLDLTPVMGLFSVQDKVRDSHFKTHNNKFDWWEYRAKCLGYGTQQLKIEVEKLNHKYVSQRQALMHIDKYELIKVGIIDLFIALGKSVEYATNVADLCKDMAIKMKVNLWDDSEKKNSIPFDLNVNKQLAQTIKNDKLKLK